MDVGNVVSLDETQKHKSIPLGSQTGEVNIPRGGKWETYYSCQ